jgi:hypothetical protein
MNFKELIYSRGNVIEKFISIELAINAIISMHYLKRVDTNFVVNVLNNEQSNFGFKKNILKQIIDCKKYKKEFKILENLNRIRNLFGHASFNIKNQNNKLTDESIKMYLNDPKKSGNIIDPEVKMKEFLELYNEFWPWLIKISKQFGIKYP